MTPITRLGDPPETQPSDAEILDVLADHFDVQPMEVLRWLDTFDRERALAQYRLALGTATTQEPQ